MASKTVTRSIVRLGDFWPITILDINLIALFYVFQSITAQIRALNPFLFSFSFWHLKTNEINKKVLKKATVGISRKIWSSNWETKSVAKATECKLIKFFLLAIAQSNSPLICTLFLMESNHYEMKSHFQSLSFSSKIS